MAESHARTEETLHGQATGLRATLDAVVAAKDQLHEKSARQHATERHNLDTAAAYQSGAAGAIAELRGGVEGFAASQAAAHGRLNGTVAEFAQRHSSQLQGIHASVEELASRIAQGNAATAALCASFARASADGHAGAASAAAETHAALEAAAAGLTFSQRKLLGDLHGSLLRAQK